MNFSPNRNVSRWIIIVSSLIIATLILWNIYLLFQTYKEEERAKMELWATAQKTLIMAGEDTEIGLPLSIITNNKNIPLILTDKKDTIISQNNIAQNIFENKQKLRELLEEMKKQNKPIKLEYGKDKYDLLYYGDSAVITKLKYYPIALIVMALVFFGLIYNFYKETKISTQNKLWAGMAKETAHQIGTPLSSLIGWLEILKLENVSNETTQEIEKDINRLQTITDRFSKIGSEPVLENMDIVAETKKSFEYLQSRSSKQVIFDFNAQIPHLFAMINPVLHSWTIENLVKNSIDAMKGKGKISIRIFEQKNKIFIHLTDTGMGIPKNKYNTIFEPGYTSKKRGWGLGLSLTKRIVEDYHNGSIKVLQSEINQFTTFEIILNKYS
jgi:two-component system, sporulation sensor kinase D